MLEFIVFVFVFFAVPLSVGGVFVVWGTWEVNRYLLGEFREEQVAGQLDLVAGVSPSRFGRVSDRRPPVWRLAEVLRPTPGCFVLPLGPSPVVDWAGLGEASRGLGMDDPARQAAFVEDEYGELMCRVCGLPASEWDLEASQCTPCLKSAVVRTIDVRPNLAQAIVDSVAPHGPECDGERYPCAVLNRGLDHIAFHRGHTMACTKPGEEW